MIVCVSSLLLTGCALNHSWFHMDSNSPMPFFGFELKPRKAASTTPKDTTHQLVSHRSGPSVKSFHPVQGTLPSRDATAAPTKILKLRNLSEILNGDDEKDISLTAPMSPFQP